MGLRAAMMRYTRTHLNKFDRTHYEKVDIYDAIPYTDSDIGHKHTLGIYVPRSSSLLSGEEQFENECDHVLTEDNINRMQSASPPSPSDGRSSSSKSSDSFYSAEPQSEVEITSCAITSNNVKVAEGSSSDRLHQAVPVIVFCHGGGWRRGDRELSAFNAYEQFAVLLAGCGYIAVAINYRLEPEEGEMITAPTQLRDVAAALWWIKRNIGSYGGNAQQIFLSGHSAGAHLLATLLSHQSALANAGYPRLHPAHFAGFIGISGVYDVPKLVKRTIWARWMFTNRAFGPYSAQDLHVKFSPLHGVMAHLGTSNNRVDTVSVTSELSNRDAANDTGNDGDDAETSTLSSSFWCDYPVLLLNAQSDAGLEADTDAYFRVLQEVGADVKCEKIPGTNHFSIIGTGRARGIPNPRLVEHIQQFIECHEHRSAVALWDGLDDGEEINDLSVSSASVRVA
jgi:acetyl esterase/lipase